MDLDFAMWNTLSSGTSSRRSLNPVIVETIPVNLTPPVISGIPEVGETLFGTTGNWSGGSLSYTYQWNLDGSGPISGATSINYVTESAGTYYLTVTASNSAGSTPADSNQIEVSESDPLAGINFALRLQTHRGNGDNRVVGLYQDVEGTIPAVDDGDPVACWRDELGYSGLEATQSNLMFQPTLRYEFGVPYVDFDGIGDHLVTSLAINGSGVGNNAILAAVAKYDSFSDYAAIINARPNSTGLSLANGNIYRFGYAWGNYFYDWPSADGPSSDANWHSHLLVVTPAQGVLYIDGNGYLNNSPHNPAEGVGYFNIGQDEYSFPARCFNGRLTAVFIQVAPDAGDDVTLGDYLPLLMP